MIWLDSKGGEAQKFVYDNTGKGYLGSISSSVPTTCGSSPSYAVNNIYDLAGNVFDWTMELRVGTGSKCRTPRGGSRQRYNSSDDSTSARPGYYSSGFDSASRGL